MYIEVNWIWWAPLGAASLHILEEFVFPGSFATWYGTYSPAIARSITPRFLILINAMLLFGCYDVAALRSRPIGAAAWLTMMALLFSNAVWHSVAAFKTQAYSPGLITGLLLYVPVTVYGYVWFLRSAQISVPMAVAALATGGSYHLWSSLFHRRRSLRPPA